MLKKPQLSFPPEIVFKLVIIVSLRTWDPLQGPIWAYIWEIVSFLKKKKNLPPSSRPQIYHIGIKFVL